MGAYSGGGAGWTFWFGPDFADRSRMRFYGIGPVSNGQIGFNPLAVAAQVMEDAGSLKIQVYRSLGAAGFIQINYATQDGTAIAGTDYTAASGFLRWEDGDIGPKTITVPITRRPASNTNVDFAIVLSNGPYSDPVLGISYITSFTITPAQATVTIIRNGFGELDFVGAAWQVVDPDSGTSTLTLTVQRFNGIKGAVGCNWHTADGTAIAGTDYTAATGTLAWADAEGGTKNIAITIKGRSGVQASRSFTVVIDTPTGSVTIGATNIATVTIVESAPITNPTPGGDPPNQVDGGGGGGGSGGSGGGGGGTSGGGAMLDDDGRFVFGALYVDGVDVGYRRRNLLYDDILAGSIVAGVIGGGGGDDFDNGDFTLLPTPRRRVHAFIF